MVADANKGIQTIEYNHLNLPIKIIFANQETIHYIYNAVGVKLTKTIFYANAITETYYQNGFQYLKNNNGVALQFFPHAEGYVNVVEEKFNYVYNYTDHLGNIRLSYTEVPSSSSLKIIEESNYYPFGLKHANYNAQEFDFRQSELGFNVVLKPTANNDYNLKFNGKELQEELGLNVYDYGARHYMADIGRWGVVDPLAEKYNSWSGYNYALNNPILFIDPDGRDIDISELMKSKDHAKVFMAFAQTKMGKAFLDNFAAKGQKLSYGGKVFYEAKEAGKYDKQGIGLNYKLSPDETGSTTDGDYAGVRKGNKYEVDIEIAKKGFGTDSKLFNLAEAISHESYIHAEGEAEDYLDNESSDYSNVPKEYRKYGTHADHYYLSIQTLENPNGSVAKSYTQRALSTLQEISKSLKLNISTIQIKTAMWNFNGSLINVNQETGKLTYKK
jgi:RHS repeat-associated protein